MKFRKENKYSIIKYINKKKLKNQMFSTTKTLSGFNVYVVYTIVEEKMNIELAAFIVNYVVKFVHMHSEKFDSFLI